MNLEGEEKVKHPAQGQISFSRVQSNGQTFYGSELKQDHYVSMEIHESCVRRELSRDWYNTDKILVRLRLSSVQFAELITSMNYGSGVPCTLEYVQGRVEPLPTAESKKDFTHRKFKERMQMFTNTIKTKRNEAQELVKKKTLSKQDIHDLTRLLDWLTIEIDQNIPFFMECFQETMDEVIVEAKTEVESAILHKVQILGLESLHEQQKLLK